MLQVPEDTAGLCYKDAVYFSMHKFVEIKTLGNLFFLIKGYTLIYPPLPFIQDPCLKVNFSIKKNFSITFFRFPKIQLDYATRMQFIFQCTSLLAAVRLQEFLLPRNIFSGHFNFISQNIFWQSERGKWVVYYTSPQSLNFLNERFLIRCLNNFEDVNGILIGQLIKSCT